MRSNILISLFVLFAIAGKTQVTDSSDYIIYGSIIKNNIPEIKKSVVVLNRTSRDEYYDPWYGDTSSRIKIISGWMRVFRAPFDSSSYSLYKEFDKKEQKAKRLNNSFQLPIGVFLIKKKSFKKLFKQSPQAGWKRFYEQYPGSAGVFEFSDIHYSDAKTKAVVYYAVRRDGLNGGGTVVILEKVNGEWKAIHESSLWAN